MTLDDLERQNRGFMEFWRFRAATQVYIIHKVEPRNYHYVLFGMTVIKVLYFIPNPRYRVFTRSSKLPANVQQTSSWPDGTPPPISLSAAYPAAYQLWAKP